MSPFGSMFFLAALFCVAYAAPLMDEPEVTADPLVWRLPDHIRPTSYRITLQPYLQESDGDKRFTFDGEVEIEITTTMQVSDISLHAKNLKFSLMECYSKVNPTTKYSLTVAKNNSQTDILDLKAGTTITTTTPYILHFIYTGQMDDDMHGFYRSSYVDDKNNTKWLGSTQFETNHARRAFPCFDEPKFKASVTVTLIRPRSMKSVSNEEIEQTISLGNGWYRDIYKTTPPLSTYLVAFIISEFNERNNGEFGVVARPEYYSQTDYAHEVGQRLLAELDTYLDIKYYDMGIKKLHMAAIPDFSAGAMENWGLLTYRERALLYDPQTTNLKDKQYIAAVVAHELTHQWFGDYVTCDWWSHTWLNEGFARYFQYFATANVEKHYHLEHQFPVDQIQSVMSMDSTNATNPMSDENTNTPADLSRMFNSISYNKGAAFIRMTKYIIGEDNFRKSLNEYLEADKYSVAHPDHLLNVWRKYWPESHKEHIDEYFRSFTEQVGYPVVTVNVTAAAEAGSINSFHISQKRFMLKDKDISNTDLIYRVPFTYVTSAEKNFDDTETKAFLTGTSFIHTHKANFSWVIANPQQNGYYRVNYDIANWHKIHHALMEANFGGIHVLNRGQIVDDLLNLARTGHVTYDDAFAILDYLRTETHYVPWTAAFNGFSYLEIRSGTDTSDFANYILALISKAYETLGFEAKETDTALDIYNRAKVLSWACKYGHADCIKHAQEHFKSLTTVPVDIRSAVYCTGIREGTENDFDHLWMHSQQLNVATETTLILNALGCTKEQKVIEKYFNTILSDQIRRQDKSAALSSLYSQNNENVHPVFKLVTTHHEELAKAMGDYSNVASVISSIASRFTEDSQLAELKDFNSKNKDKFGSSYSTLEKAEATVSDNLKWASTNMVKVKSILKERSRSGAGTLSSISALSLTLIVAIAFLMK